jgi:ATP-dependent Clp protease adaptor protein ClpS
MPPAGCQPTPDIVLPISHLSAPARHRQVATNPNAALAAFARQARPGGSLPETLASATPGSAPGGATVLDKAPERVRKPSPRYRVLLHNDPVNSMEYVVMTLRQVVPSLSEQDAIAVMLEAHNTGVGLVIVCDIEPAEFYCETLKAKGLTSTIEPES